MLQIHKDLLLFDDGIKERLDFICKYANKEVTFYNGNIITLSGTNLHYIEPHRFIINNHLFLFFNSILFVNGKIKCRNSVKNFVGFPTFFIC